MTAGWGEDCTPLEKPNSTRERKRKGGNGKASVRRRPKRKRSDAAEAGWETRRKDAWLRELLTSSSEEEEEGPERKKARTGEEKYRRFEESSRWLAEAKPTGWEQATKPEAELESSGEKANRGARCRRARWESEGRGP
jgi:hypothetical protein